VQANGNRIGGGQAVFPRKAVPAMRKKPCIRTRTTSSSQICLHPGTLPPFVVAVTTLFRPYRRRTFTSRRSTFSTLVRTSAYLRSSVHETVSCPASLITHRSSERSTLTTSIFSDMQLFGRSDSSLVDPKIRTYSPKPDLRNELRRQNVTLTRYDGAAGTRRPNQLVQCFFRFVPDA